MSRKILKRGKIIYYISDTSVVVGVGGNQYISYNIYNSASRTNLMDFKKVLLNSKPDQYTNVIDQMDLAQNCKLVGTGTRKPDWIE